MSAACWLFVLRMIVLSSNEAYNNNHMANTITDCKLATHQICLPKDYNKHNRPNHHMDITMNIEFQKVAAVNEKDDTIQTLMYVKVWWPDDRIKLFNTSLESDQSLGYGPEIILDSNWFTEIWVPDLFVWHMTSIKTYYFFQPFKSKNEYLFPCKIFNHI